MKVLTDSESWAIANSLRAAAEKFEANALELDKIAGHARLAQGFRDQKVEALKFAETFESGAQITIQE